MEVGAWMLLGAFLIDLVGVGNRKWANIIAAFLALGGMIRFLAPSRLGAELNEWTGELFDVAGDAVGEWDPAWGSLIRGTGLALLVTALTIIWLFMAIPKSTPQAGEAAKKDFSSAWIWGGAVVLCLFITAVPGDLGDGLRAVIGFGADLAETGTERLVTD